MGVSIVYSLMIGMGHQGKLLALDMADRRSLMDWSSFLSKVCRQRSEAGPWLIGHDPRNNSVKEAAMSCSWLNWELEWFPLLSPICWSPNTNTLSAMLNEAWKVISSHRSLNVHVPSSSSFHSYCPLISCSLLYILSSLLPYLTCSPSCQTDTAYFCQEDSRYFLSRQQSSKHSRYGK